jgi:hypothetical protein
MNQGVSTVNRNPSPFFKVPEVEITPEIIVAHMEKARRMRDEAMVALLKRGASRLTRLIGKSAEALSAVYHGISVRGSQPSLDPCFSQGAAAASVEPALGQRSQAAVARERGYVLSLDGAEERRPRWHLAPKKEIRI